MRFMLLAVFSLILAGCSTFNEALETAQRSGSQYSLDDSHVYNQIVWARVSVGIRTNALNPNSGMVAGIKEACKKRVQVSVLLYVGGRNTASTLAGTCAEIYVSDYPQLQYAPPVLLVDGTVLVVNGNPVALNNRQTRQEYLFERQEKMQAQRVQ